MIEEVLAAFESRRPAGDHDAFVGAVGVLRQRRGFYIEVDVVADEEVEVAVLVVVEKGAAGVPAQSVLEEAGFFGDISERAVAIVAEERILPVVADEEIVPAIVVVVANAAGLAPAQRASPALSVTSVNVPSRLFLKRWQTGSWPLGKPSSRQPLTRKMSSQSSWS